MEAIQNWAMTVCVTMAGASVFSMLIPNSNLKKMAAFTVNLFFISSLVSPLILNPPELDFDIIVGEVTKNEQLDSVVEDQVIVIAQNNLNKQIADLLAQNNHLSEKIETTIHTEQDNSISISKLSVWLPTEQRPNQQTIEQLIQKEVGVQPELIYVDE